ncbi:hypothetical protein Kfla_3928 [Kribbella flavida DSM 17836]|uniref:Uncharacterized protein n=1 Tax=Kribbella flavida (strain DSM 17836 / JCM 10339 / NBRC 14399) TaxID=479435 RepID=D2PR32_KRIFD|nr:hypothetical protein [Kribbella flavida]ADB32980.1 hypothetical protein Kfla_3928 [Kribbella flavida DSM 17836]
MDVDQVAVELYGLTPEEFTAARNQLAKTLKDQGAIAAGDAVKALRKPTLAAWLANQLVRVEPDGVHQLTELGEQLREAHLSADGARLRRLTPRRHELVQALVRAARAYAQGEGRAVSPAIADRLTETLDAALVDPGAAQLLRTGQLTSALRHVGFGVVDETGEPAQLALVRPRVVRSNAAKPTKPVPRKTLVPKPKPKPTTTAPRPSELDDARRKAQLRARAEEAEATYAEAEAERAAAESLLDANQHQIADLEATLERLNEELEQARARLRAERRTTAKLERALRRATQTAAVAQRHRDTHRKRLNG